MTDIESLRAESEAVFSDAACPAWARESLDRYSSHGIPTGDFLRAVIANDLMGAVGRADVAAGRALAAIAGYSQRHLPVHARGSYEAIDDWIMGHHARRVVEKQQQGPK